MKRISFYEALSAVVGIGAAAGLLIAFYTVVSQSNSGHAAPLPSQLESAEPPSPSTAGAAAGAQGTSLDSSPYRVLEVNVAFSGDAGPSVSSRWTTKTCIPAPRERTETRLLVKDTAYSSEPISLCLDPTKISVSMGGLLWRATQKGGAPARGALLVASPKAAGGAHTIVGVASLCEDTKPLCSLTIAQGDVRNPRLVSIALRGENEVLTYQRERGSLGEEPEPATDTEGDGDGDGSEPGSLDAEPPQD